MGKARRASTLVMVLCVFGFIVIIGVGVMTLAGVANQQASHTLGQQQADFAAQSVLDTVSAQIVGQTVDPFALGKGPTYKIEGGGSDDVLGDYHILIEKCDGGDNMFKVAVTAEKNGFTSSMYNLLAYTSGGGETEIDLAGLFDVVAGATNRNPNASMLPSAPGISDSEGSVFFDNGERATAFAGGKGVTKNVDTVGPLSLGAGSFGTQEDTHIQSTGDISITTDGIVYSTVRSEKNVTIERSQNVFGDIYATGDVTVKSGALVKGDIHAGGTVTIDGQGTGVEGTIYANGAKKDGGTFENGNVVMAAGALVQGDIYANGTVTLDGAGTQSKGTICAGGDVTVQNDASAGAIKTNGNVTVNNTVGGGGRVEQIECMGDVDLAGDFAGEIRANGKGKLAGSYSRNIYINGTVEVTAIAAMKEVHSGATVYLTGVNPPQSQTYAGFYAPMIVAENADLTYCNLYAQGKPGTIELNHVTAYGRDENRAPRYYANGDLTLKACDMRVVQIYANGYIIIDGSQILQDGGSGINTFYAWGGVQLKGGTVQGDVAAGGGIDISGTAIKANLSTNREIMMENVAAEGGIWRCDWDMDIRGMFTAEETDILAAGNLSMLLTQSAPESKGLDIKVNGTGSFENVNFTGNINVIGGGSIKNSTASGSVLFGKQPTVENSNLTGFAVVDPATLIQVAPLEEIGRVAIPSGSGSITEMEKQEIPYDEMPLVDLKLQEKYAGLPEWKIPAAIEAQMKQNNVYFAFNEKKPVGYEISGDEYIFKKNCNLTLDFQKAQGQQRGKRLVFDATDSDLYIRLKMPEKGGYTMHVTSGVQILSKGDHNVYLFLDEGTNAGNFVNWKLSGNTFMGYYGYAGGVPQEGDTRTPNLYLISNAKGVTMDISQYNTAYAYFYAPQGSVIMNGSTIFSGGAKLYGSAVASYIEMGDNQRYIQYTPQGTAGGAGIGGWTVVGTYAGTGE